MFLFDTDHFGILQQRTAPECQCILQHMQPYAALCGHGLLRLNRELSRTSPGLEYLPGACSGHQGSGTRL